MSDYEYPYCRECGSNELKFLETYADGEWWKCNECGNEFPWRMDDDDERTD